MTKPPDFTVLGKRYSVIEVAHLVNEEGRSDGTIGVVNSDDQTVHISSEIGPDTARGTYVHEWMHAMVFATGMHQDILKDEDLAERVIHRLEEVVLHSLRENPRALEYITGRQLLGKGSSRWA